MNAFKLQTADYKAVRKAALGSVLLTVSEWRVMEILETACLRKRCILIITHLSRLPQIHVTHITKQFSLFLITIPIIR